MCEPSPSLEYSPRRLVALAASAPDAPGPTGGPGGGSEGRSGSAGSGDPAPPTGPSPAASWRNLKVPMPLGRKIRLVVRNTAIKIKTHQQCCGHPGEPGC